MDDYFQHIVLISIDTLRADCIHASPRAGQYQFKHKNTPQLETPELDRLLKSSVYYNNCISAAPYTSASHGAYFTGIWPLHNGLYEFFNRKLNKPTIFQYAKKQGYKTIFQTDFPIILGPYLGISTGVDSFYHENEDRAFEKLMENKNKKTLSFFHFGGVHYPYGFHTLKFGGNDYRKKVSFLEKKYNIEKHIKSKLDDILDETYRSGEDSDLLLRYKYIVQKLYTKKKYDDLFNLYLEGINYFMKNRFDPFLKKIRDFADQNNVLLVVFSDHGEEWDAESEGHHNSTDDNVLTVPFMIYKRGMTPQIVEDLVRTIDLTPTILNKLPKKVISSDIEGVKLNFENHKSKPDIYAISQVWMAKATKREISQYQKSAIKFKKRVKPLDTYLNGEVIRNKQLKIVNKYNPSGKKLSSKFTPDEKDVIKKAHISTLRKTLKEYNNKKILNKKIPTIESQLRTELSSLGYNV